MDVLREAKTEGRCWFISITGNSADHVARVLRNVEVDTCLYAFNYDMIWRGARRAVLPLAREKGVATILGAPFHGGRLAQVHPNG